MIQALIDRRVCNANLGKQRADFGCEFAGERQQRCWVGCAKEHVVNVEQSLEFADRRGVVVYP